MGGLRSIPGSSLAGLAILTLSSCGGVEPDVTPPRAVTDLSVAEVGESAVTLAWTAPENDGVHLRVEQYDVRFAQGTAPGGLGLGAGSRQRRADRALRVQLTRHDTFHL